MYAERAEKTASEKDKTGIPRRMKKSFEYSSGFSFDDVRVHYNSEKPAQLRAHAYTQGNEIYVAPGQEKHLPHELGHVVQQKSDMVKPTGEIGGLPLNDDKTMENGADMIAENAENAEDLGGIPVQAKFKGDGVVQRANLHSEESYNLHAGFLATLIGGVGIATGIGESMYSKHLERNRTYEEEIDKYADAACEAREEQIAAVEQRDSAHLDEAEKAKASAEIKKLDKKIERNYKTAIKKAIKYGALKYENDYAGESEQHKYGKIDSIYRYFSSTHRSVQDNDEYDADTLTEDKIKRIQKVNVKNALLRARKAYDESQTDLAAIPAANAGDGAVVQDVGGEAVVQDAGGILVAENPDAADRHADAMVPDTGGDNSEEEEKNEEQANDSEN